MPEAPQAFMVVDRKGKIVAMNIAAVLEWRKKHEPEVYKAAMDKGIKPSRVDVRGMGSDSTDASAALDRVDLVLVP